MNGWIIAYLAMNALGLGVVLAKHGQEKDGKHSFWVALTSVMLSLALLYMGGAFRLHN